ncbi:hypothetical protein [Lentzea flava]|uniref:FXSXX-COOH protein n=1 Tax=Lentzea flava TaxID=103732 RepID=A0ABQ2V5C6_9PSEU|nr:hypothetical protein [Lentzea flava]MCP2203326.1 FXSXX-COOH protein [Lentzea flava]GGU66956.1 hypothetical protein GCM10010178_68440 [Lentzea flava]
MDHDDVELRSDLVDLTGIDWDQLGALPDSVLARSLEQVLRNNSTTIDQYSSFQNRI